MKKGVTAYLIQCKEQKRLDAKTLKAYRIDITQFEDYIQRNDSQYDREALRGFIAVLNQKYKPRTVKRKIASVKSYLSFLQDEEVISDNPFIGMRISLPKSLTIPRTIPLRTINAMLVEAHNFEGHTVTSFSYFCALRNTAVIELLFATGMRISELCGIAEKDLDLSEGLVFIHGKGNRERIVEIANCEVLAALKKYDQAKPKHIKSFFLNNRGNPLTDQSARRIIENCAKKTDPFRHITPHMFRHSFATMLLEEDVDIRYIQQMLGHSSISTTQIYAHVSSEKRRAILSTKHPRNKMTIE